MSAFLRRSLLALLAIALPLGAGAQTPTPRRTVELPTVRVFPSPNWQCAVPEVLRANHAADGVICAAHFASAAIRAAVTAGVDLGAPPNCALDVAARVERALPAAVQLGAGAAREVELTPCGGRTLTRDSLVYDGRSLLSLCPGAVWTWANQGRPDCPGLAALGGAQAAALAPAGEERQLVAIRVNPRTAAALDAFRDQSYRKAMERAREALAADSLDGAALAVLGASAARLGDDSLAVRSLRRAARLRPGDAWTQEELAYALVNVHDWPGAADAARAATAANGGSVFAWRTLGRALLALGHADDAVQAYVTGVKLAPGDALVRAGYAEALTAAGQAAAAEPQARSATELDGSQEATWVALAHALEKLGRRDDARRAYETALARAPWDVNVKDRIAALRQ